ncbi:MAG: DUF1351 domain-containing protein [Candidatus Gastranaerophilales bacterium]|nr:DUF1351 domain-containing protein [Candidatus Gastranaerophilales bacterium]
MNNINLNEIVKIEQMPKVFSQLEEIGKFIDKNTKDLDELECTEDNKQKVKNRRTEINNTLKALEDRRKEIKSKLLEPYELFNKKYEQECKVKLKDASNLLKTKIDNIEEEQKKEKKEELELFAKEHIEFNNLENIISFDDIGLNITLSASMKSLKDQILEFVKKISNDIECISSDEDRDEILYEYQHNGFNYQNAILTVRKRKEEINKLQEQHKEVQLRIDEDAKVVEKVDEIVAPKQILEDDEILKVTFTIETTKSNIVELKNWLKERGIKYE